MASYTPETGSALRRDTSELSLDQANIWMRGQPWYQQTLRSWGQDPAHPRTLSDAQRLQLTRLAQANGMVIDEGNMHMDEHGNFNQISRAGKVTKIALIGGGAALGGLGLFGIGPLGFLGGSGAGAAGAGGSAGAGAGTAAGVGLGETGATLGLAGPLAGLPLYGPLGAEIGGTAAGLAPLAARQIGTGAMGPLAERLSPGVGTDWMDAITKGTDLAQKAGGIGGVLKKILPALVAGGVGLGGRALAGGFGGGPSTSPVSPVSPELQQLLGEAMSRVAAQRPLFEATNRQALAGLPDYVKRG